MKASDSIFIFTLDEQRYALPLSAVNRVVRIVEVTPLPHAPDIILGAINIQGNCVAVINMRRYFSLPERAIALSDQLIIAHSTRRVMALSVDAVLGSIPYPAQNLIESKYIHPDAAYRVLKLNDGLMLIHDLDKFLSVAQEVFLDNALASS